jgi:hypothetical protein
VDKILSIFTFKYCGTLEVYLLIDHLEKEWKKSRKHVNSRDEEVRSTPSLPDVATNSI